MRKNIGNPLSRREFLECAGKASLALSLSACESLDRLVLGKPRLDDTVIVLGAGLAGLAAGIELKKKKIPFLIVDAGLVPGGRVLSLKNFGAEGETLDLGGEWISSQHTLTLKLARDLRLELMERKPRELSFPFVNNASDAKWLGELRVFSKALAKSQKVSSINLSALDWIKGRTQDSMFEDLVRLWSHFRFGAEPSEVQAFEIEREWLATPESGIAKFSEAKFRFRQGASTLVQGLYERIGGVVPQENFLWSYRLFAVARRERGIVLYFQTPNGPREITTKKVISCLPVGVLKEIEGMELFEKTLPLLRTGVQSKGGAYFANRFWNQALEKSGGLARFPQFLVWDSQRRGKLQKGGALTFVQAGKPGAEAGLHTILRWREEMLQILGAEVPTPLADHIQNWSQLSSFRGSHCVPSPGIERDLIFRSRTKDWFWAGEHVSRQFPGTMEGALETGREAGILAATTV